MSMNEPESAPPPVDDVELDAPFDQRGAWLGGLVSAPPEFDDQGLELQAAPAAGHVAAGAVGPRNAVAGRHNWVPSGPRNIGGRTNAIAFHPTDPDVMFVGTAAGGVFRSRNNGVSWEPLWHAQPSLAIGGLCISRANPDRVWAATGDPQPGGGGVIRGDGIYRSDDGGATWERMGGVPGAEPHPGIGFEMIAADPNDADFAWAVGPSGVFRTPDGGQTWQQFLGTTRTDEFGRPIARYFSDVAFSPHAAGELYLVRAGVRVARDERLSSAAVVIRIDAPRAAEANIRAILDEPTSGADPFRDEWMVADLGPNVRRGRIAICRSQPEVGYVRWVQRNRGHLAVMRCDDLRVARPADAVWNQLPDHPNWGLARDDGSLVESQGEYNLTIAVHPDDPERVATGMVDLYVTHHGGNPAGAAPDPVWFRAMAWELHAVDRAQHADHHALAVEDAAGRSLWVGCDGGLMRSTDWHTNAVGYAAKTADESGPQTSPPPAGVVTWEKRSWGITATLMYDLAQSPVVPSLYGCGFQDNGVWMTSGGGTWTRVLGADGGYVAFDPDDPYQLLATWQGGIAHVEMPGRLDGTLPVPGDVANSAFWPRILGQGFLATDGAAFVAETAADPRRGAAVLTSRSNRVYRWHRAGQGEAWSVEQVGRSVEIQCDAPAGAEAAITVLPSAAAPKLGFEPQTVTSATLARVRGRLDAPYRLAENDRLSLIVNGARVDVDFRTHDAVDVTALTVAQACAEIRARLTGLATPARCEPVFWAPPWNVEIITTAVSTAATRQRITIGGTALPRLLVGRGTYTGAIDHPAAVTILGAVDVEPPAGAPPLTLTVQVNGGPVRTITFESPRFADPAFVRAGELAAALTNALVDAPQLAGAAPDPVRILASDSLRGVTMDANAGTTLRFSGTARTPLGLPAQTAAGGHVSIIGNRDLSPTPLALTIGDGVFETTVRFDPSDTSLGIADLGAVTAVELAPLLQGAMAGSIVDGTVAVVGANVELQAAPGLRLVFSGTARAVLGLPNQTAVAGAATAATPVSLRATTALTLRITDGVRVADVSFDAALGVADLDGVWGQELLRVLKDAMAGFAARVDGMFRFGDGECSEIAFGADPSHVWIGGQDGTLYHSSDGGANWQNVSATELLAATAEVEAIAVHPDHTEVVYVGLSGSFLAPSRAQAGAAVGHPPALFRTDDSGATWVDIGGGVRDADGRVVPVNALAVDAADPDSVYAATHVGVFRSPDRGASWTAFSEGLPAVRVFDLVLEPTTRTLRAAGWGRRIYSRHVGDRTPHDVQLVVRASALDDGTNRFSALGPDVFARQPASERLTRSPDIKLTRSLAPLAPVADGAIFDGEIVHENPTTGTTNLAIQIHNVGAFPATAVRVVCLSADATLGPPSLPPDFWERHVAGALGPTAGDWTVQLDTSLPVDEPLSAESPRVVTAPVDFPDVPEGIRSFERLGLLVITSCAQDPIEPTLREKFDVADVVLAGSRCAYRETRVDQPRDHDTIHLVGNARDQSTLFSVATAAPDPALARLGLATVNGVRATTGDRASFDLSSAGGPRGFTVSIADRDVTVRFEGADIPRLEHVASWEVARVLNREFVQARLPLRARVTAGADATQCCVIEARGVADTVSLVGGTAQAPLGLPAPGGAPAASLQTAAQNAGGFNIAPTGAGPRTLTLRVHTSMVVRFDPAEFVDPAAAQAHEVRRVVNRQLEQALVPVRAAVPLVELRLRHSVADSDGPAVVTGRATLADLVASGTQVASPDQPALFGVPAALGNDTLVAGSNFLYLRSHNTGTADQPAARHRVWELRLPADPADSEINLVDIGSVDADVAGGASAIVELPWTPVPAAVAGEIRLVLAAVDHLADRPLDVPPQFASLAAVHEFCRRHPGAAYREFSVA